jgi:hypothetical protein
MQQKTKNIFIKNFFFFLNSNSLQFEVLIIHRFRMVTNILIFQEDLWFNFNIENYPPTSLKEVDVEMWKSQMKGKGLFKFISLPFASPNAVIGIHLSKWESFLNFVIVSKKNTQFSRRKKQFFQAKMLFSLESILTTNL